MKRSALRLCCAFLLMGIAVAISVGTIALADGAEQATEADNEVLCARLVLCADEPSAYIRLCAPDGTVLQTLTPDAAGQVRTEPLEAGDYRAVTEYGAAAFLLREDASVELLSGFGWSDGERLHLTDGQTGTLTVTVPLSGERGGWLDFVLTDGSVRRREVIGYTAEDESAQCSFAGVPFGLYTLEMNEVRQCSVIFSADAPTARLTLVAP